MPAKTVKKKEAPVEVPVVETPVVKKRRKISLPYVVIGLLVIVLIAGSVFGFLQYKKLSDDNKRLSNPEESAKIETKKLITTIQKLVDVPTDEEPTIATVADITKLKDQPFFIKAQNGDKVFMYAKAKKAILYRPSTGKIIEVAPITTGNTPDKAEGVKTTTPPASTTAPATTDQSSSTPATDTPPATTPTAQ